MFLNVIIVESNIKVLRKKKQQQQHNQKKQEEKTITYRT